MKLVFTKSNLNKAVGIVMKAVPTRTTMNILECILIDATTNEIKFTGNDMELGIETIVEGEIIEKGKIAIDAKLFSEIVRKLPDNDITLTTDSNNNALITCEKSKFNIAGKSGDDFSYLPAIIKDKMITLSQFQLKEVINQTIFSIAINDNNKMMTGELFEVNEGTLKVVGLDGHRIAIRNIKLEGRSDDVRVVIPGKTLQEISKILNADAESFVNIYFTNNHVLFEFDQTMVVSRLIEGEYFRIDQMLSSDYETKFIINKNRDEISKYDDLIRNRHRYAHRGVFQSSVEQYRDVINAEKYISTELSMIIANGKEYRIEYQNGWTEICSLIKECYGLVGKYKSNKNKELRDKLNSKIKTLRNASRQFIKKYSQEIEKCVLLENVRMQLIKLNNIDLRSKDSFLVIDDLNQIVYESKLVTSK